MKKLVIGITTFRNKSPKCLEYSSVNNAYSEAVIAAGGIPFLLPLVENNLEDDYLDLLDGIIFSGGEDVSPIFFHEEPIKGLGAVDSRRDSYEFKLLEIIKRRKIPILGICRGEQVINIAFGGTVYQDIDTQYENSLGHHPGEIERDDLYHSIIIEKNSTLYKIFEKEKIFINSFHHQSVSKIGKGLKITAKSVDGIIEAYESENMKNHYIMGIQWHPELLYKKYPQFLKIFENFLEEIKNKKYGG